MSQNKEDLIKAYLVAPSPRLKEEIVSAYSPLVHHISRKLCFRKEDLLDLYQVGAIGLLKSLDHFNSDKEITFTTFASSNIIGEIKHYIRDKSRIVRLPRRLQERNNKIRDFIKAYSQDHQVSPTIAQISDGLSMSEEAILESLEAKESIQIVSLDKPISLDKAGSNSHMSLLDNLGISCVSDEALARITVKEALKALPEREQKLIYLRFYDGYTQTEIADQLEVSQMHVSRLIQDALKTLKKILNPKKS